MTPHGAPSIVIEPLTERERQVVMLYAAGYDHHEIAAQLYITTSTVQGHLTNATEKLHCPRHAVGNHAVRFEQALADKINQLIAERLGL